MLQALFRFIFIIRIICSLRLFNSSTSPYSRTLFIAGHSPISYFRASSVVLCVNIVLLFGFTVFSAAGKIFIIPATPGVTLGFPPEVPTTPAFRRT